MISSSGTFEPTFWLSLSFSRIAPSWAQPKMVMDQVELNILDHHGPKTRPAWLGPARKLAMSFFLQIERRGQEKWDDFWPVTDIRRD
jgi:hypothetical protein